VTIPVVGQQHLKLLGERIRVLRKERGLTQERLADVAKIDRSYIGGVERGERNLTFTVLCQIYSLATQPTAPPMSAGRRLTNVARAI
jgi:transcriptional regulator with XRE-family HTH domain